MGAFWTILVILLIAAIIAVSYWLLVKGQQEDRAYKSEDPPDVSAG
jgi:hypothetical protein